MGVTRTLLRTVYGGGDEAVEAVERMATDWREMLEQSASEVEELQERVPQWISVSERLPDEGVRCIIAMRIPGRFVIDGEPKDGYEIAFSEWHGNRWESVSPRGKTTLHPSMVRHWMPLPEPPTCP